MRLVLYNIRSIFNTASIFRTADALGVKKIYLVGITPSPKDELSRYRKKFSKVSLGAEKTILWEKVKSVSLLIKKLKKEKLKIFAIEQSKKSIPYFKVKIPKEKEIVLILGSETKGLPNSILNQVDKILEIPMSGKKESLNVAIAFAIVGFHLKYQHQFKKQKVKKSS